MCITKRLMRTKEMQEEMLKINEEEAKYIRKQMKTEDTIGRLRAAFAKKK